MKVYDRLDPVKFNRAMAARGLTGAALVKLSGKTSPTIRRARRGEKLEPGTIRALIRTVMSVPVIEGAEELLA